MEQVKIYDYYSFGFNYTILLIDRKKSSNKVCFDDLERHINFIKTLDLRVSLSCIEMLTLDDDLEILKKLATNLETSSKDIDPALWDKIVEKLKKIDTALDGELNIKIAYLLDEKRFSNEILLNNINKLFSPKTFLLLSTIAQYDFEESGKCLAFDRYTACAFHALRGTEAVLKIYYEKILQIVATDKDTWGTFETAIVNAISAKKLTPEPEEQLILNLGTLRKYYRNKTQHPQNTYSSDEAQDLLSLCLKTVNELIADLKKRNLV